MDKSSRPDDLFGGDGVVLVDAIVETRRVTFASLLMWAIGYILRVLRDLPEPPLPGDARLLWSGLLHLTLGILLVAIAIWAPRAARSLGLPNAKRYWGAWVPCANPFVVLVLVLRLLQAMSSFGVSKTFLFATRQRLESEL